MIDLLARRYANLDFMAGWDFSEASDFIVWAIEKEAEEKLEHRWALHYQDQFSFEDFKRRLGEAAVADAAPPLPTIEADVANIMRMEV